MTSRKPNRGSKVAPGNESAGGDETETKAKPEDGTRAKQERSLRLKQKIDRAKLRFCLWLTLVFLFWSVYVEYRVHEELKSDGCLGKINELTCPALAEYATVQDEMCEHNHKMKAVSTSGYVLAVTLLLQLALLTASIDLQHAAEIHETPDELQKRSAKLPMDAWIALLSPQVAVLVTQWKHVDFSGGFGSFVATTGIFAVAILGIVLGRVYLRRVRRNLHEAHGPMASRCVKHHLIKPNLAVLAVELYCVVHVFIALDFLGDDRYRWIQSVDANPRTCYSYYYKSGLFQGSMFVCFHVTLTLLVYFYLAASGAIHVASTAKSSGGGGEGEGESESGDKSKYIGAAMVIGKQMAQLAFMVVTGLTIGYFSALHTETIFSNVECAFYAFLFVTLWVFVIAGIMLIRSNDAAVKMRNLLPQTNKKYHVFLSHMQNKGQMQCEIIDKELRERGVISWRDQNQKMGKLDQEAMAQGIKDSIAYLLFFAKGTLRESWMVRFELKTALRLNKPVIVLFETKQEFGGHGDPSVFITETKEVGNGSHPLPGPDPLGADGKDISKYLWSPNAFAMRRQAQEAEVLYNNLAERIAELGEAVRDGGENWPEMLRRNQSQDLREGTYRTEGSF